VRSRGFPDHSRHPLTRRKPISPTARDNPPFRAPKGVTQALALVLADGGHHGSSGGGGIGVLLLILLIVWVLAR